MTQIAAVGAGWGDLADEVAALLARAWSPPALEYPAAYLRWQATFPGGEGVHSSGVTARDGDRLVGFAAATPRRVAWAGESGWVHVVSFVAVDPDSRGQGLSGTLYDALLGDLAVAPSFGVLTFAQEDSNGLAVLEAAYRRNGFGRTDLGLYRTHAAPLSPAAVPAADGPPAPALPRAPDPATRLDSWPDAAEWAHQLADPRGVAWVSLGDGAEGGLVTLAHRTTAGGPDPFCCVRAVYGPAAAGSGARLRTAAAGIAAGRSRIVTMPNPEALSAEDLRGGGFRALPGAFVGRWYHRPGAAMPAPMGRTTMEIV
ncbi:MAG: GNAT family N-acetyltransferase [Gemmatimonadales bacterium]